jgi:integrase
VVRILTDASVRKYRPGPKRRFIRDGAARSLYLVIQSSGHRSWMMRFRTPTGRIAKITLGPLHVGGETQGPPVIGMPLTLAGARQLAAEVHRDRAQGRDVAADRRAQRHRLHAENKERTANTFASAARMFIEEYARPKTRRWFETAPLLGLKPDDLQAIPGGLADRWADKSVREIDGHDIYAVVDEARRIGVPGIVPRRPGLSEARPRALFSALSAFFGWLVKHRRVDQNPCTGVHRPDAPAPRERVLKDDEVRWFWLASDAIGEPFGALLKLLLLTGARRDEVAGMTCSELSDDCATWSLAGSRTKNKKPHVVPLPPMARDILASLGTKGDLLFTTTGTTPVSGWSKLKRRLDAAMLAIALRECGAAVVIPPWRLHDLRRTVATGMAGIGIAPHIVEAALNHVSGAKAGVAGVYNRAAYAPEKKDAMERWSCHVAGLVSPRPENVVNLPNKRVQKKTFAPIGGLVS